MLMALNSDWVFPPQPETKHILEKHKKTHSLFAGNFTKKTCQGLAKWNVDNSWERWNLRLGGWTHGISKNLPPREERPWEQLMELWISVIRFGGGNHVFFRKFQRWNLFCFFGMTKYGMKKFRLMVWNPPVFYILARVFTILSSKSPGIRNPSNVRIVQI